MALSTCHLLATCRAEHSEFSLNSFLCNISFLAMLTFLNFVDNYSWTLLTSITLLLAVSAFAGKYMRGKRPEHDTVMDDELKIVLGATLSLFGLLIGFILSFAISGYNMRAAAEENEAVAIGNAFQRTTLLAKESHQDLAEKLLHEYLSLRIQFFETPDDDERARIRQESIQKQTHMWHLVSQLAKDNPNPVMATVLNASNELYTAQQKTMASWRHQIPGAAWVMLVVFAICSNFLIGYNVRGKRGSDVLLMVVPAITALALFMISEIDVPGKGVIHVTPYNLEAVRTTLDKGGLVPEDNLVLSH